MLLFRLVCVLEILLFCIPCVALAEAEKGIIVLDASGSMWGQVDGTAKIVIARESLGKLLQTWPKDREVGLIAYGHRRKGDCEDIEILVPPSKLDVEHLVSVINQIQPKGKTPLSAAVQMAAEELKYTEEKATVILISDGIETCDLDPCAIGSLLEEKGVDFTAHVIGFDVKNVEDQKGLRCLAENTGGKFISAQSADELNSALEVAIAPASPEPSPSSSASPVPSSSPLPSPSPITLEGRILAPESAVKGTELKIKLELAQELPHYGYVYLYFEDNTKHVKYVSVSRDETGVIPEVSLRLPTQIGKYRLVWESKDHSEKDNREIASHEFLITDTETEIVASDTGIAGTLLPLDVKSVPGLKGYIYLFKSGNDKHITYSAVQAGRSKPYEIASIRLPSEPGEYQLLWKTNQGEFIAEKPLVITEASSSLEAPETGIGGTEISLTPTGTDGLDGYVYLHKKGIGKEITYVRVVSSPQGGYKALGVRLPLSEGPYDLIWKSTKKEVLASHEIIVTPASIAIKMPESAVMGTEFPVILEAPEGMSGYFHLYKDGKDKDITYARVKANPKGGYQTSSIRLPAFPGKYTVKYLTGYKEEGAIAHITATSATMKIIAPVEVAVGEKINIEIDAPEGLDGYVHLYKKGAEKSITYERVRADSIRPYAQISIVAPRESGEYELRWYTRGKELIDTVAIKVN